MGFFNWFNPKKKYLKNSVRMDSDYIEQVFNQYGLKNFRSRDLWFMCLTHEAMKALVFRVHDTRWFKYHGNSEEFPDCDDSELVLRAQVIKYCAEIGMPYPPVFGGLSYYSKKLDEWHRANWSLDRNGRMWICEPQAQGGLWYKYEEEVKEAREARI